MLCVRLGGDWTLRQSLPSLDEVTGSIAGSTGVKQLTFDTSGLGRWDSGLLTFLLIGFLLLPLITIWWLVFCIIGAIKASSGEWYRIPLNISIGG